MPKMATDPSQPLASLDDLIIESYTGDQLSVILPTLARTHDLGATTLGFNYQSQVIVPPSGTSLQPHGAPISSSTNSSSSPCYHEDGVLAELIRDNQYTLVVVRAVTNTIVALAELIHQKSGQVFLDRFEVIQEYRKLGVGRELIRYLVERYGIGQELDFVLDCPSAAIPFYLRALATYQVELGPCSEGLVRLVISRED